MRGETTGLVTDPLIDLLGPIAAGTDDFVGYGGSQCSTAASVPQDLRGDHGVPLIRYTCPKTDRVWCCEEGQADFVCWEVDHPQYVPPALGVSRTEADSLAATEIAHRAAVDAELHRARAQSAAMLATAMAQTAADKAATDHASKEAALAAAAETARARRETYEVALANADATHRARRVAIAAGTLRLPPRHRSWRTKPRR